MIDAGILQDFLVESAEIAEQLSARLLDLESRPQDPELVNAVFRAFHTIKGGAGFLELTPVVELCHLSEELMGQVRAGQRQVDPRLTDLLLGACDALRAMLATLAEGGSPQAADASLLAGLRAALAGGEALPQATAEPAASVPEPSGSEAADPDPVAAEFERLLAAATGGAPGDAEAASPAPTADAAAGDDGDLIDDDEFERLLDQFHGGVPGAGPSPQAGPPADAGEQAASAASTAPAAAPASPPDDAPPEAPDQSAADSGVRDGTSESQAPACAAGASRVEPTVRVETRRLDTIMNLVGELVLARNRIKALRQRIASDELERAATELDLVTLQLQDAVMKTRMQPVGKLFRRYPLVARDLARKLGKSVRVVLEGEDTDLDKNLVEELADPLVHLVRNAVDHGLETPERRRQLGKPEQGMLRLAARHAGDHILIVVEDDGAGMDPDRIRVKAVERGLLDADEAARMTPGQLLQLIFQPGFSTRDAVSDISGRGVGMDVVRSRIEQLGGSIQVESRPGQGTAFLLRVPLTLAILPSLMVGVGHRIYALPLGVVVEVLPASGVTLRRMDGNEVLDLRGGLIPVVDLAAWAGETPGERRHFVVVQLGSDRFAVTVDDVLGREEVVVKPLGAMLQGLSGVSGATITGDGAVALILDLPGVLAAAGLLR